MYSMPITRFHSLLLAALLWGCGTDQTAPPPAPISSLGDLVEHTTFADEGLERAVRFALNQPRGPLTDDVLDDIDTLDASQHAIGDLSGIGRLTALRSLTLGANALADLAQLSDLDALQFLDLSDNQIQDLAPLTGLNRLSALDLSGNQVADLQPLAGLGQLTYLDLDDNLIRDIAPLAALRRLRLLNLDNNLVRDITALMGLRLLRDLELSGNPLDDLDDIANLNDRGVQVRYFVPFENPFDEVIEAAVRKELGNIKGPISQTALDRITTLSITGEIQSLSGIDKLRNLDALFIRFTGNADLRPNNLTPLPRLRKLTRLTMRGLALSDIAPLGAISLLRDLSLPNNAISDLRPLASLTRLRFLNLAGNEVSDLTPLINLNRLTTINLTNNEVSDLSPVGAIADLKQVWVRGNPLSSETLTIVVPALREAGIFVVGI